MQLGHVALAATIASFAPELTDWVNMPATSGLSLWVGGNSIEAFSLTALLVSFLAHWLPNMDVFPIWAGIAKDSFHCTWSHSLVLILFVGIVLWIFNPAWAVLAVVSLILHILADMPSSVGLPILLPFTKKRFTFNLWADTGHSGWFALRSTYEQSWTWFLEGAMFVILFIRMYQLQIWPF